MFCYFFIIHFFYFIQLVRVDILNLNCLLWFIQVLYIFQKRKRKRGSCISSRDMEILENSSDIKLYDFYLIKLKML